MKKKIRKFRIIFDIKILTLKVRILHILTTFTQVTARFKNFLMRWLGLKEGLVEYATVCVKSWVILIDLALLSMPSIGAYKKPENQG